MDLRSITRFFIERWQFTLVFFTLLIALGMNAIVSISKSEDPPARFPIAAVTVVLPGADAERMEKLVAIPIERALLQIEDLKDIESDSYSGVAVINAEFIYGVDPERKFDEVVREVNRIRGSLPEGIIDIDFIRANTANANIVQMALVSPKADIRQMEAYAKDLRDAFERVNGVQEAEIWGAPQAEVRVALALDKLATYRVSPGQVVDALSREGAAAPIGAVEAGGRRFNLQTSGDYDSLEEIARTPLLARDGRALTVGDVAEISWANDEARHITRYKGERALFITARAKLGENVFDVRNRVYAATDAFEGRLPSDIKLERGFDQSKNVSHRLANLSRDFAIAIALVLITLLPLGMRAALVVMMSIPLSLAIGVLMIQQLGYTMNQLSISGFVIALGLLVDDSIVVTENIARRLREGLPPKEAAVAGVEEIDVAVIGCTATLLLAFLPLLFLPEGPGDFIRSLPVAVICTVSASLLVSLTIIPFLASKLLDPKDAGHTNPVLERVMGLIHSVYRPILHLALERPRRTVAVCLGGCLLLSALIAPRLGFSLFPETDSPQFVVNVELPQGAAITETDKAVRFVETVLAKEEEVDWWFANTGYGNPQVYYNVFPERTRSSIGQIYVSLKEWKSGSSPKVLARMRESFAAFPGARITLVRFENGPPVDAPIVVRLSGKDLAALDELAEEVERIVRETPGTRDVKNPLADRLVDLDLNIDETKAGLLGVPAGAVDQAARIAIGGASAANFIDPAGEAYPVRVRLPMEERMPAEALNRLFVWTQTGEATPLSELARPQFTSGPARISRFNQERVVQVTAYTQPGYLTSRVTNEIAEKLDGLTIPAGYSLSFGGQAEAASSSFSGLGAAFLIAAFGILAVLLLEFRTFGQMTVVAFVIPFGVIGGLVALFIAGMSLSFVAIIGFIALVGIEIKNSILLVDFANKLRARGMALREAVEQAGEIRFLPVLLTSATAIGGMTPLVIEQNPLVSPLAVVIIGGLISSTILARIVTPAMYLLLADKDPEGEKAPASALAPAE